MSPNINLVFHLILEREYNLKTVYIAFLKISHVNIDCFTFTLVFGKLLNVILYDDKTDSTVWLSLLSKVDIEELCKREIEKLRMVVYLAYFILI